MKTIKITMILAAMFTGYVLNSCTAVNADPDDLLSLSGDELKDGIIPGCIAIGDPGNLTDDEKAGLMEMREEEKLAHDVYVKFYSMHKIPTFNNISNSEAAHQKAVLYLIDLFKLKDPSKSNEGEFTIENFSDLYNKLVDQDSINAAETLKAKTFIKEHDINDLIRLIEKTQNTNIKRVYTNLLNASKIHLKAFSNVLFLRYKETYKPLILSEEIYNEILSAK